ncbi:hypothetical protein HEE88_001277 [Campylobacter upsaliensis]|uniref:Uncharacterized protein n=2 Tax=Campylobacter TaxID=194 RepID=A0ABS5P5Z0_9BACT|nr:hypothetical protein [Campylobacter vulpis]EAB5281447.1 hypothetical protein [Campylobacter upsaliensis]ECP7515765.1 hypothetical protein [Campylobacter jejuni]EAH5218264.1 hypothetical protein [Campylobacter upsaliensis]EAH6866951.1 hypothetical protein [Campylobacter upsaliensis]EAI0017570.1 hypothetical protein [Campylobacter upsaliensis]
MLKKLKCKKMNNLKAVRLKINGCDFKCNTIVENYRFSKDGKKIVSTKLKAFILEDGDIFDIDNIESVLWVDLSDKDKNEYWIDLPSYAEDFYLKKPIEVETYFS